MEAHARKVGVSELKLSSSLTARGFYERLGYRLIEPEEHDGVSTFLMAKTFSQTRRPRGHGWPGS